MLMGLMAIRRCLSVVAVVPWLVVGPALAQWSPSSEPVAWRSIRQDLEASERLEPNGWIFIDAMTNPKAEAAEYLRDLERRDNTVLFLAALLLRRQGEPTWTNNGWKCSSVAAAGWAPSYRVGTAFNCFVRCSKAFRPGWTSPCWTGNCASAAAMPAPPSRCCDATTSISRSSSTAGWNKQTREGPQDLSP